MCFDPVNDMLLFILEILEILTLKSNTAIKCCTCCTMAHWMLLPVLVIAKLSTLPALALVEVIGGKENENLPSYSVMEMGIGMVIC